MTDMSMTIAPKSDQLNSDDLIGGPRTIKITRVSANEGTPEQPINMFFEGDNGKPYRPCKSMRRVLVEAWGKDGGAYVGRSMTLYRDPEVQFGGLKVGGTRISHMSNIDAPRTMALTASRAARKPYTVKPLVVAAATPIAPAMPEADAIDLATKAASKGTGAFRAWFNTDQGKDARKTGALTQPVMADLQKLCAGADKAISDDPFGLPPIDPAQATDTEISDKIAAEVAARDRELEGQA